MNTVFAKVSKVEHMAASEVHANIIENPPADYTQEARNPTVDGAADVNKKPSWKVQRPPH